jgi:hypothetical protein
VDEDQEITWDVTVPLTPVLLNSIARAPDDNRNAIVIHTGKRVGAVPTSSLLQGLGRLANHNGPPVVIGSPRVGGIGETLYIRTQHGAILFDISHPEEPHEVHIYEKPAWYEGGALGGKLMVKHNPSLNVIELYAATATKML